MEYVRAEGYPVPAVEDVTDDGTGIVMERIDGPSMVALMGRRPWTLRSQGATLADLHRRLHTIAAPDWVGRAPGGDGDRLVHLDLHPLNVIAGPRGPVVIDWSNAARGLGAVDVAVAWILIASGELPFGRVRTAVLGRGRQFFLDAFLRGSDGAGARRQLQAVVEWKVLDPNMTDAERQRMRAVAAAHAAT